MDNSRRWTDGAAALAVAAVAAATFGVAMGGGFVWDDLVFLPTADRLRALADPLELFRTGIWAWSRLEPPPDAPVYRPVAALVLWLLGPVLGASTIAWHALPILLHATNAALVHLLVRRWRPEAPRHAALAAGLLFAVLPCHLEAVAWIMAFVHPLATLLALLAAHAQLRHARGGGGAWQALAATAAGVAALVYEGALVLPALLLAIEAMERGSRPAPRTWLAAALAGGLPLLLRTRALSAPVPLDVTPASVLRALEFTVAYLRDLVMPWAPPPHGSYPRHGVAGLATWILAPTIAIGGSALLLRRSSAGERRRQALALLWIAVALVPAAAAAMNANPLYAPRALYLPSVGLALLVGASIHGAGARASVAWSRLGGVALLAGVAIGNVGATGWTDETRLYRRIVDVDPASSKARLRLAHLLEEEGREAEAEAQLAAAADRVAGPATDRLDAAEALATFLGRRGRLDEAERVIAGVIVEDAGRSSAWTTAGNVALLRRDVARAEACYERAVQLSPRNAEAAYNLALARRARGAPANGEATVPARRPAAASPGSPGR
jgi:tetratricopeptide (TPR) repeat protein